MGVLIVGKSSFSTNLDGSGRPDLQLGVTSHEIKRTITMNHGPLHRLDGSMIEVQFSVGDSLRTIMGRGKYDFSDPDYGSVLKILVADPQGEFEFVLPESTWQGVPEQSSLPGCDFRISLVNRSG